MTTIYSIDANGQERYDTVHPDNVGKQINILKRRGQLKIQVIKNNMEDYRTGQKVVALIKLEDQQQDFLELDVLENGVLLGNSPMFSHGILSLVGIGTVEGFEWYEPKNIKDIPQDYFEAYELYVYFKNTNEPTPVPWEAKTLKYKVVGVGEAEKPDRFIK